MPDTQSITRFPDRFCLRVPRGLPAAVELAAQRHHTSPSEWARQTLLRGLEADGVRLCKGRAQAVDALPAAAE
jgi:hypothetical protein